MTVKPTRKQIHASAQDKKGRSLASGPDPSARFEYAPFEFRAAEL
jgi:hypothetical protein